MASAIAPGATFRLCGDGDRSDHARLGTADATVPNEGDGYDGGDRVYSRAVSRVGIVLDLTTPA